MNVTLTALRGVRVGHATDHDMLTGVTVLTFDGDVPVATCCHGGSPGTFNTDPFDAGRNAGRRAQSIFISGGSYAGLQSGAEIMRELIAQGIGFQNHAMVNPCVTGAIVMDLGVRVGQFDPALAAEALANATTKPVQRGDVGAGTGTAVGKFFYPEEGRVFAGMKAGVGCARVDLGGGGIVVALSVVNALGNIVARDGSILAGNRSTRPDTPFESFLDRGRHAQSDGTNTTISVVGTNVALPQSSDYDRVAHLASHGHVRAINPVNLEPDGDTVFVFSTEEISSIVPPDADLRWRGAEWRQLVVDLVGQAAAEAVQDSIYDACHAAETTPFGNALDGVVPSCHDLADDRRMAQVAAADVLRSQLGRKA